MEEGISVAGKLFYLWPGLKETGTFRSREELYNRITGFEDEPRV
jgi:hypothetical protein